jgi:hypothetical protein
MVFAGQHADVLASLSSRALAKLRLVRIALRLAGLEFRLLVSCPDGEGGLAFVADYPSAMSGK